MIDISRMSVDTETLVFSYLINEDTGTYYCILKVGKNITVIDMFTVAVIPVESQHVVDVGFRANLYCNQALIDAYLDTNNTRITW